MRHRTPWRTRSWIGGTVLAAALALPGPGTAGDEAALTPPALAPVHLALQWLPQSQFAGFYMACDQGFYRAAGLDVTLLHAGPGPSSLDFLADGRADFATLFLSDAVVHAQEPVPLVQVVQLMRRSNLMLVAWKDMGIMAPGDLDGQRISCWTGPFSGAFTAFFQQHGVHPVLRPQNHSVNLFLNRGVAVCAAMAYNEYHRIYQAGIDYDRLTTFMMRDYGLGFPEDGIYTTAAMAAAHPERCRALRQATLAGWEHARQHPDEAIAAVLRESKRRAVPVNRAHSRWMLMHVLESIFPPDDPAPPGSLDPQAYARTVDALASSGLVEMAPPHAAFAPFEEARP
jgi:NitT/TauT family transport system substrate-binding protein